MKIGVVIPVYNNKTLFLDNLKHNFPFISQYQIIVVDDCSSESIEKEVAEIEKEIKIIKNVRNLGFGVSVNKAVQQLETDLILLVNSDVRLNDDSYLTAIDDFNKDRKLFAVSFSQIERNGQHVGKNRIFYERGMVFHAGVENSNPGFNAWAEGGSSIIRKKYFDQLEGFDPIYNPFYWEDIDLSYRAYKRGWHINFTPFVSVEHFHESTIGKYYSKKFVKTVAYRNQFIFIWKNLTDSKLFLIHLLYLPYYLLYHVFKRDGAFIGGFLSALPKIAAIINNRKKGQHQARSDKIIFTLFDNV